MDIAEILGGKQEQVRQAARRHCVASLFVFGSMARGEARPDSDVDILVEFARPTGLFAFVRLKRDLEAVLGRPVDLVTREALKPQLLEAVLKESLRAA
jgi:predicted nucleotidyltransferase